MVSKYKSINVNWKIDIELIDDSKKPGFIVLYPRNPLNNNSYLELWFLKLHLNI